MSETKIIKTIMKIVPAKRKHRLEMKSINEKCLPENYPVYMWEEFLSEHCSFVLLANNQVVGYIVCADTSNDKNKKIKSIVSFAISQEYRNKKWGNKLLSTALIHLQSQKVIQVELNVRVGNTNALQGSSPVVAAPVIQILKGNPPLPDQ